MKISKELQKKIDKIEKIYEEACEQIDENPFIKHKISFIDRFFGATISQGDFMKQKLFYQKNQMISELISSYRIYKIL